MSYKIIKSLKTYNVPFEKSSNDRFSSENIEQMITPYFKENVGENKFSYDIATTTSGLITITGKKANYAVIDGDLFPNKPRTYWFLSSISDVQNDKSVRYKAELDVIATFFGDVKPQMENKRLFIERAHPNRYVKDGDVLKLNRTLYNGFYDSEFKGPSMTGSMRKTINPSYTFLRKHYTNLVVKDSGKHELVYLDKMYYGSRNVKMGIEIDDFDENMEYFFKISVDGGQLVTLWINRSGVHDKTSDIYRGPYYSIEVRMDAVNGLIGIQIYDWTLRLEDGTVPFNYILTYTVADASVRYYEYQNIPTSEEFVNLKPNIANTELSCMYKSGDDFLLVKKEIENWTFKNGKIYYAYALVEGSQIVDRDLYFKKPLMGSDLILVPVNLKNDNAINSMAKIRKLQKGAVINVFLSPIPFEPLEVVKSYSKTASGYSVLYSGVSLSGKNDDGVYGIVSPSGMQLDTGDMDFHSINFDMSLLDINGFKFHTKIKLNANGKITSIVANEIDDFDVSSIPNLEFKFVGGSEEIVDISTFEMEKVEIRALLNEMGLNVRVDLSPNQYMIWNEQNYLSYATSQAETFLATNKNSIETEKKRIDLEQKMQAKEITRNQVGSFGGGVVGGALSLFNPATWGNLILSNQIGDVQKDIASVKKQAIASQIADLRNASDIFNMGKENSINILQQQGISGDAKKWHIEITTQNPNVLRRIIEFIKRHGSKLSTWIDFKSGEWMNRERYNFLQINELRDILNTTDDMDVNVIDEISKEFSNGIRIWNDSSMNYGRNLEKNILPLIETVVK